MRKVLIFVLLFLTLATSALPGDDYTDTYMILSLLF
jgi:hypothetical protein